jgi:hypothetical protein
LRPRSALGGAQLPWSLSKKETAPLDNPGVAFPYVSTT